MIQFLSNTIAWLVKNAALIIGVIESIAKLFAGVASLTPTKSDDKFIPAVDDVASNVKKYLYKASEALAGKEITGPNY